MNSIMIKDGYGKKRKRKRSSEGIFTVYMLQNVTLQVIIWEVRKILLIFQCIRKDMPEKMLN